MLTIVDSTCAWDFDGFSQAGVAVQSGITAVKLYRRCSLVGRLLVF
jgi:hypothetical protein